MLYSFWDIAYETMEMGFPLNRFWVRDVHKLLFPYQKPLHKPHSSQDKNKLKPSFEYSPYLERVRPWPNTRQIDRADYLLLIDLEAVLDMIEPESDNLKRIFDSSLTLAHQLLVPISYLYLAWYNYSWTRPPS